MADFLSNLMARHRDSGWNAGVALQPRPLSRFEPERPGVGRFGGETAALRETTETGLPPSDPETTPSETAVPHLQERTIFIERLLTASPPPEPTEKVEVPVPAQPQILVQRLDPPPPVTTHDEPANSAHAPAPTSVRRETAVRPPVPASGQKQRLPTAAIAPGPEAETATEFIAPEAVVPPALTPPKQERPASASDITPAPEPGIVAVPTTTETPALSGVEVAVSPPPPVRPKLPPAPQPRPARHRPTPEPPPEATVQITIGRVEVRANAPASPPQRPRPRLAIMSLDEYLQKRERER